MKKLFFLAALLLTLTCFAQQPGRVQRASAYENAINPLNFGLREAKDGKARFEALMACHRQAVESQRPISYSGIDTIELEIPKDARTLPLPYNTDFAGVVIKVKNNSGRRFTLFTLHSDIDPQPIKIEKGQIDAGNYQSFSELSVGYNLLVVKDRTPWSYLIEVGSPVYRSDVVVIDGGRALNSPIYSYSGEACTPECSYVSVSPDTKTIENVTIIRERKSTNMTFCFAVNYQYNVIMRNIHIITRNTSHYGDQAIAIFNCANCTLADITIDSTYSSLKHYGYAFSMTNVLNCNLNNLNIKSAWSPFETYCLNNTTIRECSMKRFDLLCYGRNLNIENCTFKKQSVQVCSFFGDLVVDNCIFDECIPLAVHSSYNAYTPFEAHFNNCTMNLVKDNNALVNIMLHTNFANRRPELNARCWPNVYVSNLTVNTSKSAKRLDIILPTGNVRECDKPVDYLQHIEINGLRSMSKDRPSKCDLYFSRHRFKTKLPFKPVCINQELEGGKIVYNIND